ncbi:hypothetical protein HK096_008110, partial [Nowakowskiella sp. JEL0078]
ILHETDDDWKIVYSQTVKFNIDNKIITNEGSKVLENILYVGENNDFTFENDDSINENFINYTDFLNHNSHPTPCSLNSFNPFLSPKESEENENENENEDTFSFNNIFHNDISVVAGENNNNDQNINESDNNSDNESDNENSIHNNNTPIVLNRKRLMEDDEYYVTYDENLQAMQLIPRNNKNATPANNQFKK